MSLVLQGGSSGLFAAALGDIACRVLPASAVACSRQETALYQHVAARLRGEAMCGVAHVQCPSASTISPTTSPNGLRSVSPSPACTVPHRQPACERGWLVQHQRVIVGVATTTKPVEP